MTEKKEGRGMLINGERLAHLEHILATGGDGSEIADDTVRDLVVELRTTRDALRAFVRFYDETDGFDPRHLHPRFAPGAGPKLYQVLGQARAALGDDQ